MVRSFFAFWHPLVKAARQNFPLMYKIFLQFSCVQWIHVRRKHAFRVTVHLGRCISRRVVHLSSCLVFVKLRIYTEYGVYLGQQQVTSAAPRAALPPTGPPVSQPARRARLMVLAGHGANADTPVVYRTHRQHEDTSSNLHLSVLRTCKNTQLQSSEHDCADRPVAERHRGRGRG